ncbi:SpoIID/LytB domain-containing protein [Patescibacteria group bacterium]|nr:SpoIID/LytB domain-containing protein [Patescibacteria group bacterium]MCL5410177.1 SpoIID/LytB domain-containing protein [Patescibacteria group bacterium]
MKKRHLFASAILGFLTCLVLFAPFVTSPTKADEIDDLQKQIDALNKAREMSVNATKPLEGQLDTLRTQLASIQVRLQSLSASIAAKEQDLQVREDKLVVQQVLLNSRVRSYYIRSFLTDPLTVIFSQSNSGDIFRELSYRQATTQEDQKIIMDVTAEMIDLSNQKDKLEKDKASLAVLQKQVDENATFLNGEITKAKAYQADLSTQIAQLSARQQQLIAQKLASLGLPTSAYTTKGGCSSDLTNGKDPGFSPKFALFTYGVPHRVGLNQYGALGRAQAGQNYSDILHTYFNADLASGYNQGITIHVAGTNEYGQSFDTNWNIEEYVKHVYEVPADWPMEALKAQAIAARSYALAYTNNGSSSICPSQSCQVVKQELNSSRWIDAVNATAGQVLTSGGQPIKAWFSSTAGGYYHSSSDVGWNSTAYTKTGVDANGSVSSFADLQSKAYDHSSPWFYCDWGSRSAYSGTAWLKPDELADIVNVLILAKADSSTQQHLSQVDKPNPDGVDTWDAGRVKQELRSRGTTPFNSIDSGSVDADFSSGATTTVHISGDAGSRDFSGTDFKNYFNLRAPSNINIVGPLFTIEKR